MEGERYSIPTQSFFLVVQHSFPRSIASLPSKSSCDSDLVTNTDAHTIPVGDSNVGRFTPLHILLNVSIAINVCAAPLSTRALISHPTMAKQALWRQPPEAAPKPPPPMGRSAPSGMRHIHGTGGLISHSNCRWGEPLHPTCDRVSVWPDL